MRVFIIQNTPLNAPLPLSVYLTDLLRNVRKEKDIELNLIVGKSPSIPTEIKKLCKKIYQFDGSTYSIKDNINFSFYVNRVLKAENKKKKIDIAHCFYANSSLLGAVMFKMLHNRKTKIIYDVRSPWIDMSIERGFIHPAVTSLYRKTLYAEEKFLCKRVNSFMFVTSGLAKYYSEVVEIKPNQKVYVSPSGVDLSKFKRVTSDVRKRYGVKNDEILIGSVGGIAKVRKQDEFLRIFSKIVRSNSKVKLMFVGAGDLLEDLKALTKKLHLESKVIFTGSVPHAEVPKFMSAFDFGLNHLPNMFIHRHNCSLKIMEYLSCGVPVIASTIESNLELAKKLKYVYIYRDHKDILRILKSKPRVTAQSALDEFSWKTIVRNYQKMWEETI